MRMEDSPRPLTTVSRAFKILESLGELGGAGPSELAERLNLPASTVYDYLRTLNETEFVARNDGEYRLTYAFLTVGARMKYRTRLFRVAKPEMERLAADTGELVGLTVEDDDKGLILHQEGGNQALSLGTYPGAAPPLHTNASGKTILAHMPEEHRHEIIYEGELIERTDQTITDPETLATELSRIRDDGQAVDWDQQVVGMGMAAAPIFVDSADRSSVSNQMQSGDDTLLGVLTLVGPTERFKNESYHEEILQKLQEATDSVKINYLYGT